MAIVSLRSCVTPLPFASSMNIQRGKAITAMKVEIRSRKFIKPSISTPHVLRHYKISFIDEFAPKMYVPLVLFFPLNTDANPRSIASLEESLAKTLTLMCPLAGRYIEDPRIVDCNDHGAEFIQAQADITIQELLDSNVDTKEINKFMPYIWAEDQITDPILATQVTMFQCGGLALGVNIAHRIGDASTLITFLNQWAALNQRDKAENVSMGFSASSLFPARGLRPMELGFAYLKTNDEYVTKRLSFKEGAISKMKSNVTLNGKINNDQLSKVQLVSGLIWKAFIGVDRAIYGHSRHTVLVQPINLRHKTATLIPENAFGNLWGLIVCDFDATKMITESEDLTNFLTHYVKKTIRDYSQAGNDYNHERKQMVLDSFSQFTNISDTTNLVWLTSWCKFPFYSVDFGFGKPAWISLGCAPFKRGMVLMDDAEGNGVEAYVNIDIKHVPYFEQDEGIKAYSI